MLYHRYLIRFWGELLSPGEPFPRALREKHRLVNAKYTAGTLPYSWLLVYIQIQLSFLLYIFISFLLTRIIGSVRFISSFGNCSPEIVPLLWGWN